MALSFAIAAEGQTDQRVIDNILTGFFRDAPSEISVQWDYPERQEPGGWGRLFSYLREKRYAEALQFNDYLVVQIDSDCAHEKGFGIPRAIDGRKAPEAMVTAVRARLEEVIGVEDLQAYAGRLLFAVCVESIECWLLPLHAPGNAGDVHGCLRRLNHELKRKGAPGLKKDDVPSYANASAEYRRRKVLLAKGPKQPSLAIFLQELEAVVVA